MKASKYVVTFCILILLSCGNNKKTFYLGENAKCDAIDTNSFVTRIKSDWPTRKPNSIADAVQLLDSIADDNFKCVIIKTSDENLYFNLGLKIRNDWVRHGTTNINDQLFNKLKLSSEDYSSGLIIDIYRQLLTNKKIDLVNHFSQGKRDTSWHTIRDELITIQRELGQ